MPLIIPSNSQSATGYTIDQSIRFNDDDSAFMKKDYSGDGSQTTFTLSGWFKLGILTGSAHSLFATGYLNGSVADFSLYFSGDQLYLYAGYNGGSPANKLETTQLFRDHSAWYHIVFVADTTNAVSEERLRLYVNGSRVTAFDTETYPSQNNTLVWGDATYSHAIGASGDDTTSLNSQTPRFHYDGYMAEIHYLDGLAYDPSFFGEFNDSGIWIPKEYTGSYGTNGFKIDGRDSSDLGDDESGNGNDFTTSGLAAHDQMLDSPTNNFCVMNAIENVPCNFSEGNLTLDSTANFSGNAIRGTVHIKGGSTGKWYYEVVGSLTGDYWGTGWMLSSIINPSGTVIGQESGSVGFYNTGSYQNTSNVQGAITKPAAGDVIGVGLDASTGQVFLRDDTGYFVGTLSSNVLSSGVVITGFDGEDLVMASRNSSSGTCTYNFGQDGTFAGAKTAQGNTDANGIGNFFYTVPDGFLAICTKNLGS